MANVKCTTKTESTIELNGECKRMTTIFSRIEKAVSTQVEEIQHNAIKALKFVKAEFDDNKYCDLSSFKYNNVCVTVKVSDRSAGGVITYVVNVDVDFEFDSMCESIYAGKLLREFIDGKHDSKAEATEQTEAEEATESEQTEAESDNDCVWVTSDKITIYNVCDFNEVCTIKAYQKGKELTVPINKMRGVTCVIEYISNLFNINVVQRDVYFEILRAGKRNIVLTYVNANNIVQLYNISPRLKHIENVMKNVYSFKSEYIRKISNSQQYDTLAVYNANVYVKVTQRNDNVKHCEFDVEIVCKRKKYETLCNYATLQGILESIAINPLTVEDYCKKYFT